MKWSRRQGNAAAEMISEQKAAADVEILENDSREWEVRAARWISYSALESAVAERECQLEVVAAEIQIPSEGADAQRVAEIRRQLAAKERDRRVAEAQQLSHCAGW